MIIIGLTGGIGMGKSTVARLFKSYGIAVHSADKTVHRLLGHGGAAVPRIAKIAPQAVISGSIDRSKLSQEAFAQPELLKKLERLLHPLVRQDERTFVAKARRQKAKAVVLEIPLLFETKAEKRCTFVITVTTSRALQKSRVLRRKGMTERKFQTILKAQWSDKERRRLADLVLPSDKGLAVTRQWVKAIIGMLQETG